MKKNKIDWNFDDEEIDNNDNIKPHLGQPMSNKWVDGFFKDWFDRGYTIHDMGKSGEITKKD